MIQLRYTTKEVWKMACTVAAHTKEEFLDFKNLPTGTTSCWLTRKNARASLAFPDEHTLIGEWSDDSKGWVGFRFKDGWHLGSGLAGRVRAFYFYTANRDEPKIREVYLCNVQNLNDEPKMGDVHSALKDWGEDWVWIPMVPDPEPDSQVLDLDVGNWREIKRAAAESSWIPEQYYMNDWVSDVCEFLRVGCSKGEFKGATEEHPTSPPKVEGMPPFCESCQTSSKMVQHEDGRWVCHGTHRRD